MIRKDYKKGMSPRIIGSGIRGLSTVGALSVSGKLQAYQPKAHGPLMLLIGVLGDAFVEKDEVRAITQGIGSAGAYLTAKQFLPEDTKTTIGLSGVEAGQPIDWGQEQMGAIEDIDYQDLTGLDEDLGDIPEESTSVDDVNAAQLIAARSGIGEMGAIHALQLEGGDPLL